MNESTWRTLMEFLFLIIWGLLAWGVSALAISRGRSGVGFFLLSFLFSPLLGLVVVLVMRDLVDENAKANARNRQEESRERLRREEHERQLESIKAIAAPQKADMSRPQASTATSALVADEIRKLGALRAEGLLTDAEFQTQKSVLLASPSSIQTGAPETADTSETKETAPPLDQNGVCPNCFLMIPLLSKECPRCNARPLTKR
jgi:hypothetical protein